MSYMVDVPDWAIEDEEFEGRRAAGHLAGPGVDEDGAASEEEVAEFWAEYEQWLEERGLCEPADLPRVHSARCLSRQTWKRLDSQQSLW